MVALELRESAINALVFREKITNEVSNWMTHRGLLGEVEIVACAVDVIAELLVAA